MKFISNTYLFTYTHRMANIFKKGLILGGLLAVGAAVGIAMSDEGQQFSEDVQKDLKTLAKQLKKRLHDLEDITEESYDALVSTVVDEFEKQHKLAEGVKKTLVKSLKAMWNEMEKVALEEKEGAV